MAAADDELTGFALQPDLFDDTVIEALDPALLAPAPPRAALIAVPPVHVAPAALTKIAEATGAFTAQLARFTTGTGDDATPPAAGVLPDDIEGKIARAEAALTDLLGRGHPVCVAWSAGKDSSVVLNLLLVAAAKLVARGQSVPPIVVTHADTGVENPEMQLYARNEMLQVKAFARAHRLDLEIEISHPNLSDQWAVRVIGGRALPPFPGTNRDCTKSWKISPMAKLRKRILKKLRDHCVEAKVEPIVLIGTRFEESEERARRMRERGESDTQVRRGLDAAGKPSHLFLSPIAFWSADDVWEYLGTARAGAVQSYSDFDETFRVYADAMATSCAVVAEDMARLAKSSKACGARHGCSVCTAVTADQSMENMLTQDRYEYMRGLNQLRNFLSATRWDMGRRSWLGRTITDGYIRIAADAYSPAMMEELLRYALTIDVQEREAAMAEGIRPRFQLISVEQLFAIDAMWSLQAFHRPHHALKIYNEICNDGARYPVPEVPTFARPNEMPERYLWVGADWEDEEAFRYTGLRSAIHEMTAMDSTGCMGNRTLPDGLEVLAINTEDMLTVEAETAYFLLDEELPRLLERHDAPGANPTAAYFYYVHLGVVSVKAGQEREIDMMLRRANWKVRQGVAGEIDHTTLLARSITAAEAGKTRSRNGATRARGADGSRSEAFAQLDTGSVATAEPAEHPLTFHPRQRI